MNRLLALTIPVLVLAGCGGDKEKSASSGASSGASAGITEEATDFKFSQTDLTAKAGKVKVTLSNQGQAPHEFVVLKTDEAPDALKVKDGRVSEDGSVGEIAETEAGKSASKTFDLEPGKYVFVCNIPGHYGDGMRGQLTVN